jgi:pyruvate/2-oxoacid:ferredoxin oxidoreductase beta subunit
MREDLQRRLDVACTLMTASPFNVRGGGTAVTRPRRGLIAAGAPRSASRLALARLGANAPLLELGTLHPLPHDLILPFLRSLDEVLVVEELTPYLEDSLLAIAHHHGVAAAIHGKRDGKMPWPFELEPEEVETRVRAFLELPPVEALRPLPPAALAPPRPPVLCAGCPHRNTFHSVTAVFGADAIYVNDIGCYTLGASPPHEAGDVLLAMGSSLPIAAGIARTTGQRVVAFLGDSTFFHSGMPALLDVVEHDDDVVLVVMDNGITAMTGLQPSAATVGRDGGKPKRRIAEVARALGAADVTELRVGDLDGLMRTLERVRTKKGVSVVVAEGPCALLERRDADVPKPQVDESRCHTCGMLEAGLHCGIAPSLAAQRRVAAQRAVHGMGRRGEPMPRTSPCSLECPVGICIPAYVGAISAGEPERAFAAVSLRAALPSVCSHVCHRPCEDACVRAADGHAVAVNALKRYLTERHYPVVESRRPKEDATPVAVVGAGPAGLAAARELARRGYFPTLFDARERAGGMLEYAIPDYRLPREVLRRDVAAVFAEGVRFEGGRRLGKNLSLAELRQRGFPAIVLALGAARGSRPELPGASLPGTGEALEFLAAPPEVRGERVVVLGGGDVGIDVARTAIRGGAAGVTVVFPEPEGEMAAAPDAAASARAENVVFVPAAAVIAVEAGKEGRAPTEGRAGKRWRRRVLSPPTG